MGSMGILAIILFIIVTASIGLKALSDILDGPTDFKTALSILIICVGLLCHFANCIILDDKYTKLKRLLKQKDIIVEQEDIFSEPHLVWINANNGTVNAEAVTMDAVGTGSVDVSSNTVSITSSKEENNELVR